MTELPVAISLLAFAVSVASLTISLLAYLRDRSKLHVWSTIGWQFNGPEPQTPVMRIRIANIGRRPVLVLNLIKKAGKAKWWRSIQQPDLGGKVISTVEQIRELKEKWLAHHVAVKLGEGEILELSFQPEDCHEFIGTHEDPPVQATSLQVEDVSGRLYSVRDSTKNLAVLMQAWNS